jgi:hypothetical protein
MLAEILVFLGLMSLLGVIGTIIIKLIARRHGPVADPHILEEIAGRLAHLEQVTESTAVEVERIGEGQRFTTKLLGERQSESAR